LVQGVFYVFIIGETPFKPLTQEDTLMSEFTEDFREVAPLFDVNFDAVVEPVALEEMEKI
jgi:hypothetical protein